MKKSESEFSESKSDFFFLFMTKEIYTTKPRYKT